MELKTPARGEARQRRQNSKLRTLLGVTLIEIAVVLGIMGVILTVSAPVVISFYLDYQLRAERDTFISFLERARHFAMVNQNESAHGLFLDTNQFILFEGINFAARDPSKDLDFPRASAITFSGPNEVAFSPLSGRSGSSTITISNNRNTFNIYVNQEGQIDWD